MELKPLPILFFGHNRRKLAVLAIQRLKQHMKFTGYTPKFIFGCCGTDEDYIKKVQEAAGDWLYMTLPMRQPDPTLNNQLNCMMNDAIKEAMKISNVAFRMEDDWIMEKDLDIGPWMDLLENDEQVYFIRLGQIQAEPDWVKPYRPDLGLDWLDYRPNSRYPVNNQCGAFHKRLYQLTGYYREDFDIDEAEFELGRKFRILTHNFKDPKKVLWPHGQPVDLDESPARIFVHAGGSTLGHSCFDEGVPERYWAYQEDGWIPPRK